MKRRHAFTLAGLFAVSATQYGIGMTPLWAYLLLPVYIAGGFGLNLVIESIVNGRFPPVGVGLKEDLRSYLCWVRVRARQCAYLAFSAAIEEALFRVFPLGIALWYGGIWVPTAVLVIGSLAYGLSHLPRRRRQYRGEIIDHTLYGLILGAAYLAWPDMVMLIAVHTVRNTRFQYLTDRERSDALAQPTRVPLLFFPPGRDPAVIKLLAQNDRQHERHASNDPAFNDPAPNPSASSFDSPFALAHGVGAPSAPHTDDS